MTNSEDTLIQNGFEFSWESSSPESTSKSNRTTYKMVLRSIRVQLIDFPDINLKKLRDQIKQFDLLDKGWFL